MSTDSLWREISTYPPRLCVCILPKLSYPDDGRCSECGGIIVIHKIKQMEQEMAEMKKILRSVTIAIFIFAIFFLLMLGKFYA